MHVPISISQKYGAAQVGCHIKGKSAIVVALTFVEQSGILSVSTFGYGACAMAPRFGRFAQVDVEDRAERYEAFIAVSEGFAPLGATEREDEQPFVALSRGNAAV